MHAVGANLTGVFLVANMPNKSKKNVFLCEFKHSDKENFLLFSYIPHDLTKMK